MCFACIKGEIVIETLIFAATPTEVTQPTLQEVLRSICSVLEAPVIIVLFILAACTIVLLGSLLVEAIVERPRLKARMPALLEKLRTSTSLGLTIQNSGILRRQKRALLELIKHPDFTDNMRESLAVRLLAQERARFERIVKVSDVIVRLGPVFGLLGTLIPLGPGIIALGRGDTFTLSSSLLTAFDTTIVGLLCSAVAAVISMVRNQWYKNDMSVLETLMECVLEVNKTDEKAA